MDMLWYGHKYGFVPDADYDLLWNKCKGRYAHPRAADLHRIVPCPGRQVHAALQHVCRQRRRGEALAARARHHNDVALADAALRSVGRVQPGDLAPGIGEQYVSSICSSTFYSFGNLIVDMTII